MFSTRKKIEIINANIPSNLNDINSNIEIYNLGDDDYDTYFDLLPEINLLTGNSCNFLQQSVLNNETTITKKPVGIDVLLYVTYPQNGEETDRNKIFCLLFIDRDIIYIIKDIINFVGINSREKKDSIARKSLYNILSEIPREKFLYGTLFMPRKEYSEISDKTNSYIMTIKNLILFKNSEKENLGFKVENLDDWTTLARKLEFTCWLKKENGKWFIPNSGDIYSTGGTWFKPATNIIRQITDEKIKEFNDSIPSEYSSIKRIFTEDLKTRGYDSTSDILLLNDETMFIYYYYTPYDMSFFPQISLKQTLSTKDPKMSFERMFRLNCILIPDKTGYNYIFENYMNYFRFMITDGYFDICDMLNNDILETFKKQLYNFDEYISKSNSLPVHNYMYISNLFNYLSKDFLTYYAPLMSVLMLNRFKKGFLGTETDKERIGNILKSEFSENKEKLIKIKNEETDNTPENDINPFTQIVNLPDYDNAWKIISDNWNKFNNFFTNNTCILMTNTNICEKND